MSVIKGFCVLILLVPAVADHDLENLQVICRNVKGKEKAKMTETTKFTIYIHARLLVGRPGNKNNDVAANAPEP